MSGGGGRSSTVIYAGFGAGHTLNFFLGGGCGFSAAVVQILSNMNVVFKDINVLNDVEIREGIKKFSDWPTIPQLYVKGEFVGGCDIVKELFEKGELKEILKKKNLI